MAVEHDAFKESTNKQLKKLQEEMENLTLTGMRQMICRWSTDVLSQGRSVLALPREW